MIAAVACPGDSALGCASIWAMKPTFRFDFHLIGRAAILGMLFVRPAVAEGADYPPCNKKPTRAEVSAAQGAFEAGQVSFHEADYDRTILYWEDAFRRDCTATALLLNLARAYELADQPDRAATALETYLSRHPELEDRSGLEKRIRHLKTKAERKAAQSAPAPEPAAKQVGGAQPKLDSASSVSPPPPEPASGRRTPDAPAVVESPRAAAHPAWPVIVTGSGLVLGIGSGIGMVLAGQEYQHYRATLCSKESVDAPGAYTCDPDPGTQRSSEQVSAAAQAAYVWQYVTLGTTIGGGVLAVGGAILWAVTWSSVEASPGPKAMVTPIVGPGIAGLSCSGQF